MPGSPLSSTTWPSPSLACSHRSRNKSEFVFAAHQRRQASLHRRLKATLRRTLPHDLVERQGVRDALQRRAAPGPDTQTSPDQPLGGRTDDHRVGRGLVLAAGRQCSASRPMARCSGWSSVPISPTTTSPV